ncbi:helix-turn-helix domain-containing protein [Chloroflexota bacterium]
MKHKEIAQELGISKSYLSMILSGQRNGNNRIRKKISSLNVVNFEAESSLRGRCPKPLDECAP